MPGLDCIGGTCNQYANGDGTGYTDPGFAGGSSGGAGLPTNSFTNSSGGFPTPNAEPLGNYAEEIVNFINDFLVPVLVAIAFIVFLYGVYRYFIQGATNEDDRKTGRTFVLYGLIGFVLIFALWGVVNLVGQTFGLTTEETRPNYPTL